MLKQNTFFRRLLAISLAVIMTMSAAPMTAFAEDTTPPIGVSGEEIIAVAPLGEETEKQAVVVGGSIDEVYLPATLTATIQIATDTDTQEEEAEPSFTTEEKEIPVTWDCSPSFDGNQTGVYTFMPAVNGYTVSAELPQITVDVIQGIQTYAEPTAAANSIISQINSYNTSHGGTGSLMATADGDTVTITGSITGATSTLILELTATTVNVIWNATLKTNGDFSALQLRQWHSGSMVFQMTGGEIVTNNTDVAFRNTVGRWTIRIQGGEVRNEGAGDAIRANGNVYVSGGKVMAGQGPCH